VFFNTFVKQFTKHEKDFNTVFCFLLDAFFTILLFVQACSKNLSSIQFSYSCGQYSWCINMWSCC